MNTSFVSVTDLFCGAGGSTTGAMQAGAEVRLAVNHWPRALETHQTNYPHVEHMLADISQTDPRRYPSTTVLLASPECTNHSLSKGVKRKGQAQLGLWEQKPPDPAEERSRCTMWDPLRFTEYHHYPIIIIENVVDARYWRLWDAWLHGWQVLDTAGRSCTSTACSPTRLLSPETACMWFSGSARIAPPTCVSRHAPFARAVSGMWMPSRAGRIRPNSGASTARTGSMSIAALPVLLS